jgi:hypothetical protein
MSLYEEVIFIENEAPKQEIHSSIDCENFTADLEGDYGTSYW